MPTMTLPGSSPVPAAPLFARSLGKHAAKALPLLSLCAASGAFAQAGELRLVEVATQNGCTVLMDELAAKVQAQNNPREFIWDGPCAGGKAHGTGRLITRSQFGEGAFAIASESVQSLRMSLGLPFGYARNVSASRPLGQGEQGIRPMPAQRRDHFAYTARAGSFGFAASLGWAGDNWVASEAGTLPNVQFGAVVEGSSVSVTEGGVTRLVLVMKAPCALFPELRQAVANCGTEAGQVNTEVFFLTVSQITGQAFQPGRRLVCPEPTNVQSCLTPFQREAQPIVETGLALMRNDQSRYTRLLEAEAQLGRAAVDAARSTAAVAQASGAATPAAQTAAAAAAPAESDEAYRRRLDTLKVGELFALADEMKQAGQTARMRQALRALLSRFPDHALAKAAAEQLGQ